jgi:rhodanese-related sulfurtransferase/predicted transcriptional regulator
MTEVKKQLFEQLALIAHSLSSPQRIELLDYLAQAERGVDELSQLSGLTTANTSRHLQVLKTHGLVVMRKQGKNRFYRIAGADVVQLVMALRHTAQQHLAEVDRLIENRLNEQSYPAISVEEVAQHLDDKRYLLLDVRPEKEFAQGHVKGAVNVPPNTIEEAMSRLPHDKVLVAYCRGPYCTYSYKMVKALQQNGVTAMRLEEGFPEWKAAGLPYETLS